MPTFFNHTPVVVVTIASNDHAAATTGDFIVWATEFYDKFFDALNVFWLTLRRHVTTIDKCMNAYALNAVFVGLLEHFLEVSDIGMNVTIAENTHEM